VALKLVNFASLDPDLKGRGVGGMANVSHADREVWNKFFGQWDSLVDYLVVEVIPEGKKVSLLKRKTELLPPSGPTEVTGNVKIRRGQSFFRGAVMAAYECRCCITGITCLELLRASHIIPWSQNPSMRLDPRNGLCLNALHDAAFDRGLITLSDNFELRVSKRLKSEVPNTVYKEMFESRSGLLIQMPERFKPTTEMLEFHQNKIFCG
jgi:putative restriction endonuclease